MLLVGFTIFFIAAWFAGYLILGTSSVCRQIPLGEKVPRVSLIIPARDEAHNLSQLFASLADDEWNPYEIIVVNDSSTDGTAAIAEKLGAWVLNAGPLPVGWTGKNWACHQGAQVARGDILFFIDADCFFKPGGYSVILNNFIELCSGRRTALSILPWHEIKRTYENLSLFFNLIMAAGSGGFKSSGQRRLVGQSLIVTREDYLLSGGHAAVKGQVLENFFMTDHFLSKNIAALTLSGRGVMSLRMFPDGIHDLVTGWSKAFARGARYTDPTILGASILWLSGFATVIALFCLPSTWESPEVINLLLVTYSAYAIQLYWLGRKFGSFGWWAAAFYPVTWLFYQYVFVRSVLLRPANKVWKGRPL